MSNGAGTAILDRQGQELQLPKSVSVKQLADQMGEDPINVIKSLIRIGVMANINQVVDFSIAATIATDLGFEVSPLPETSDEDAQTRPVRDEDPANLIARPPMVTILGHVDHGKTTLLDAIRKSKLTEGEVGGITQHIGAYQVEYKGEKITFLDTPGHEAFTAMRARGAKATDVAVLVVAADDGVMPQTIEAINHAKAAGVPIVVAINKMDVPGADIDRVKRQLLENELVIEELGGEIIAIPISAKDLQGIDELLENILVVAEVAELKANPNRPAMGVIVEAQMDKSMGPLATVLIQTGTLHVGETVVVGSTWGRVKAMLNESGRRVKIADPSTPVEILGLGHLPMAGDILEVLLNEKAAKDLVGERQDRQALARQAMASPTLEEAATRIGIGELTELNLIIKTDVQGTVDAVRGSLEKLSTEKAKVNIIHANSGTINESDIMLAAASKAIIIGFTTRIEQGARHLADTEKVDIRQYDIIYRLVEDVQSALEGLVKPISQEVVEGHGEVRVVFTVGRRNRIAGVYVTDGRIARNSTMRILRKGSSVHQGTVSSLKRFKDDAREVTAGFECGLGVEGFTDFQEGDILEALRQERGS